MELTEKYKKLDGNEKINKTFNYKPMGVVITSFIVGTIIVVGSIMYGSLLWILGAFMVVLSLVVFFGLKDHKAMSITETGIIVYNPNNDTQGINIDFEDIAEWKALGNKSNEKATGLLILLTDDSVVYVNMFGAFKTSRALRGVMPEKEASKVAISKIKNTPLSWFNKKR